MEPYAKKSDIMNVICISDDEYRDNPPISVRSSNAKRLKIVSQNIVVKGPQNEPPPVRNHNNNNVTLRTHLQSPLSPDSTKTKREFCQYLKLMKPISEGENKERLEDRNKTRRSMRVKNNTQEQDKTKFGENVVESKTIADLEQVVISCPTLKSLEELNIKIDKFEDLFNEFKRKNSHKMGANKYMPLPTKNFAGEFEDFELAMADILQERKSEEKSEKSENLEKSIEEKVETEIPPIPPLKVAKIQIRDKMRKRFRFKMRPKLVTLSRRGISIEKIVLKRKCATLRDRKKVPEVETTAPPCETPQAPVEKVASIVYSETVAPLPGTSQKDVDLGNFVDDMLELNKLSEEHRKSIIESRMLLSNSKSFSSLLDSSTSEEVREAVRVFSEASVDITFEPEPEAIIPEPVTPIAEPESEESDKSRLASLAVQLDHDYAGVSSSSEESSEEEEEEEEEGSENAEADPENAEEEEETKKIEEEEEIPEPMPPLEVAPVHPTIPRKSLQGALGTSRKTKFFTKLKDYLNLSKSLKHSINVAEENGAVIHAFYQDFNLVVTQQTCVSFWTQSPLGNVLGTQDMWIPKGSCQRLANSTFVPKESGGMITSTDFSVAYVELWTKEHKSELRQVPLADVFVTVYFWKVRQEDVEKKALQLENIQGSTEDVQYVVLRNSSKIVVSWRSIQGNDRKTKIHAYQLAPDFQIVTGISDIHEIDHYVNSLHNVEDAENLVMGCGENKISIWNVDYGHLVATIQLDNVNATLDTFWVRCDRGFLFTVQETQARELRLIAINGLNRSWKTLQSYQPPSGFDDVKGVYLENGILVAYYAQGIACWNAQNGDILVAEISHGECEFLPSGNHVIIIANGQIMVRHSLSHFITADDLQDL